jgi:hypothetical protein
VLVLLQLPPLLMLQQPGSGHVSWQPRRLRQSQQSPLHPFHAYTKPAAAAAASVAMICCPPAQPPCCCFDTCASAAAVYLMY